MMRVALRNPQTSLYFRGPEDWTPERQQARDFQRTVEALRFATEHKLSGLEVMLLFDNPEHDVVVART
jgi:hypothetical protein